MKFKLMIFVIIFWLSSGLCAQPRIEFEKTEINFGDINEGETINVEFRFKNTGDEQLVISSVRPSCGCTVTRLKQKKFKPGEAGIIPARFMSAGFGGTKVFKTIAVNSNDRRNPSVRLVISGNVSLKDFARIEIQPEKIDFGRVRIGKSYTRTISLKNSGNKDLEIMEVTHIPDITLVFSESVVGPNGQTDVEIIFKPMRKTNITNFVRFRTNAHRQYYSLLKINADIEN